MTKVADAGLESIIAALQEYSVSQPSVSETPVDPSLDVARLLKSITDKIDQIPVPTVAEDVVEKAATKPKKVEAHSDAEAEDEEVEEEDLTDEQRMEALRERKKATKKSMNEQEVLTVVQNAVAPLNESITKLTELITVMAQTQMTTAKAEEVAAPVVAAPVVEATEEVETVEKSEEVAAPAVDTDALIARIVEGLAARLAPAPEVVENAQPVAKSQEVLTPTTSYTHQPAYVNAPGYTPNAHNPIALESVVAESPTVQATNVLKSMGYQASVPVVRTPIGVEATADTNATSTEDEVNEINKSVDEFAGLPFRAINKLREDVGAW